MTQQAAVKLTLEYGFKGEFGPGDRYDNVEYHWLRTTAIYNHTTWYDFTMFIAGERYNKATLADRFASSVNKYFLKKYQLPAEISAEEIIKVIQP